jgi:hypothetical protein
MDQPNKPRYGKLILIPALITLGITLLRLCAEFMNMPAWLASREPGGLGGPYRHKLAAAHPGCLFRV